MFKFCEGFKRRNLKTAAVEVCGFSPLCTTVSEPFPTPTVIRKKTIHEIRRIKNNCLTHGTPIRFSGHQENYVVQIFWSRLLNEYVAK